MKNKLIIIFVIALVALLTTSVITFNLYKKEKSERKIAETNLIAKSTELKEYVTKLGDTVTILQGMRLDLSQAKQIESRLINKVKNLEIKLKNATGVIEIVEKIKYVNKDSIIYIPLNDSTRRFEIKDPWLSAKIDVTDFKYIKPGGFIIDSINNTSTIVPSVKTKGWWIFKKTIGIECFIQNTNPYISVQGGTYIDLRKIK